MCFFVQSKAQRQPANTEVQVVETRERAPTPAPTPAPTIAAETTARKPEIPTSLTSSKPTQETIVSSPTAVPVSTASALVAVVPVTSSLSLSVPLQTPAPSSEPTSSRPVEGVSALGGPNDLGDQGAEERKPKDPQVSKESVKAVLPVESTVTVLESTSMSSLLNFPPEEGAPSPPLEQDQQSQPVPTPDRPPTELTTTTSSQTGLEKDRTLAVQEVGKVDEAHHPGSNGCKKKPPRAKKMKLFLIKVTQDDVVKCLLVTAHELKVNFQFSSKFDETREIFRKLVSSVAYTLVCSE